ncbi:hypothetical protein DIZ27_32855 [Streptomyces sp. NWU339]|uniref:hypothetical protein n=1 Tax=Streptomyces sp. NWU339 TaxID=2185284 RepID=UPI000D67D0C7|nr:hypothetical protein [Streptomyces sp. NWU339]PWI06532.1 hypothetical protein DIZ27_32855 [Streptomyces sp. NWU339]
MALPTLAVHEIADAILGCVCSALDETAAQIDDYPGCPCRACVVPGTPAWDGCADPCTGDVGGQLTVSTVRLYPSRNFPEQDTNIQGVRGCTPPPVTAVEYLVTLLRCAPLPNANGCPPTCDEQAEAARIVHIDSTVIMNALLCCLPGTSSSRRGRKFVLGPSRIVGPEGGCVGVEQRVTVALPGCGCPSEGVML